MALKVVKLTALPAAVGLASFRVYAMTEEKTDEQISPRELSIYNPEPPVMRYVDERPGRLQAGLGRMRVGLQPYVRTVQDACTSVKVGVISLYQAGQDTYEFLREPPPGFLPRVGVITVSGLAGLVLARKGSRMKRIGVPLALTTVGTAVCYPTQTVGVLKFTGKKVYSASSVVASALKSKPKEDFTAPPASLEPVTPNFDLKAKAVLESEPVDAAVEEGATSDTPSTTAEMIPTLTGTITPETELVVVGDVAESDVVCLPETEPTLDTPFEDAAPVSADVASVAEVAPDPDDAPDITALPEGEPETDASWLELAPAFTSFPDVPQEDAAVSEVSPTVDGTPIEAVPPDFALEETIPVEVTPKIETAIGAEVASTVDTSSMNEVTSEMTEDVPVAEVVPLLDVIMEKDATVNEVMPTEDASAAEVAPLPDVTQEDVAPTCEVALAEDALVAPDGAPEEVTPIEIAPVAEVSPVAKGDALSDLVPEEAATVSEVDAASELDLVVETSPVVEVAFLPDVTPEEAPPAEVTLAVEVVSAEVAPDVDTTSGIVELAAVDETLSESVKPLADPTLEAEVNPLPSQLQSEPEAALEPTPAAETVPDFEVDTEAVAEAALRPPDFVICELVPTEEEVTPIIPLSDKESTLSALPAEEDIALSTPPAEPTPSPTAFEATTPLPPVVEETGPLTTSVEETTPGPSTTDEIASIPDVIDEAPLTLAAGLETTSSSPADEAAPPTHAEDETTPLLSATEDTALLPPAVDEDIPPPAAVEETKPPAEVEEVLALKSPAMKEKPRFVPDPSLVDHGQAHPDDADMYSTRG
ncbi:MICOS complex subunit MIC27 [Colossoma macropomum]|uniref:MICOS complex subunit MIC27 n=1 Tax=Colossoma macropomum TaxID=42526 RepID=UPI0018655BC3|nr:MICOS complex subunit MIC27 [Colossoma macropomum]